MGLDVVQMVDNHETGRLPEIIDAAEVGKKIEPFLLLEVGTDCDDILFLHDNRRLAAELGDLQDRSGELPLQVFNYRLYAHILIPCHCDFGLEGGSLKPG
jgi:hypothetical protein